MNKELDQELERHKTSALDALNSISELGDGELVRAVRTLAILNVRLAQMIQAVLVLAVKP